MDILTKHRTAKDFKKFWKATDKHDIKPSLPVSVDGISEPVLISNMFRDHFKVHSPLGPSVSSSGSHAGCDVGKVIHITAGQMRHVLKKMACGKSPGHDGLGVEHLRHAGVHLPRVLAMFFAICVNRSYLPHLT